MSPGHKWVLWSQLIEWRPNKRLYSRQRIVYVIFLLSLLGQIKYIWILFIRSISVVLCLCVRLFRSLYSLLLHSFHFSLSLFIPFHFSVVFLLIFLDFLRKNKNAAEWYPCSLSTAPYNMWINAHTLEIECYLNDILLWLFSFLFLTFTTNSSVSASFYFLCLSLHSDIVFFFPGGLYFGGFI